MSGSEGQGRVRGRRRLTAAFAAISLILCLLPSPAAAATAPSVTASAILVTTGAAQPDATWTNDPAGLQVTLAATATNSNIKTIAWTNSGADTSTGSSPSFPNSGGATRNWSVFVFNEGITTISYSATDWSGLTSTPKLFTVEIDFTSPTVTAVPSAAANANGWTNQPVTINFQCDDPSPVADQAWASGVTCPSAISETSDGTYPASTFSVQDAAGNSVDVSVPQVKVDATPPTVGFDGAQDSYTPDQVVSITCTASDDGSGLDAALTSCSDVNGVAQTFGLGVHTYTATATDLAGNSATPASVTFTVAAADEPVAVFKRIAPSSGGLFGGATATIRGKNLGDVSSVLFGTAAATILSVTDTTVTVTTPAAASGLLGKAPVTLINPAGSSTVTSGSWFTYVEPRLTGSGPSSGPAAGGTSILLSGSGRAASPASRLAVSRPRPSASSRIANFWSLRPRALPAR